MASMRCAAGTAAFLPKTSNCTREVLTTATLPGNCPTAKFSRGSTDGVIRAAKQRVTANSLTLHPDKTRVVEPDATRRR